MSTPKGVTIKLTEKQRTQIRNVVGQDHAEIRFEKEALSPKTAGRRLVHKNAGRRLVTKNAGRRLVNKNAGRRIK
jgi:hypothetical protein